VFSPCDLNYVHIQLKIIPRDVYIHKHQTLGNFSDNVQNYGVVTRL